MRQAKDIGVGRPGRPRGRAWALLQDFVNVRFASQEAAAGSQAVALLGSGPDGARHKITKAATNRRTVHTRPSKPARFSLMASRLLGSRMHRRALFGPADFQPRRQVGVGPAGGPKGNDGLCLREALKGGAWVCHRVGAQARRRSPTPAHPGQCRPNRAVPESLTEWKAASQS